MKKALWLLVAATVLAAAGVEAGEPFEYRDTAWSGPARMRLVAPRGREVLVEDVSNVVFFRDRTWRYDSAEGAWDDWKSFVAGDFDAESRAFLAERAEDAFAAHGQDPGELTMLPATNVSGRVSPDGSHLLLKMRLRYRIGSGKEIVREFVRLDLALIPPPS